MVKLKTHAGWNKCNPSLLSWDLRSAGTYILKAHFISSAWLCFNWLTIQPSFSTIYILTDVLFTCVTGLCVLYKWYWSMGAKAPTFFQRKAPLPISPPSASYPNDTSSIHATHSYMCEKYIHISYMEAFGHHHVEEAMGYEHTVEGMSLTRHTTS